MAKRKNTYELAGGIVVEGHEVATFTVDVPLKVTGSKDGTRGVVMTLDPITPHLAAALREMADAIDPPKR